MIRVILIQLGMIFGPLIQAKTFNPPPQFMIGWYSGGLHKLGCMSAHSTVVVFSVRELG